MDFQVEEIPNYRIAYLRRTGPYGPENKDVMERLKIWAKEKDLLKEDSILFAIAQDNPEVIPPEQCRFDACLVIPEDYKLEDEIIMEGKLSRGKYVVFKVRHTAQDLQKAYAEIFPILQRSGYQIKNKPIIEKYEGKMVKNDYCEICIPVV